MGSEMCIRDSPGSAPESCTHEKYEQVCCHSKLICMTSQKMHGFYLKNRTSFSVKCYTIPGDLNVNDFDRLHLFLSLDIVSSVLCLGFFNAERPIFLYFLLICHSRLLGLYSIP